VISCDYYQVVPLRTLQSSQCSDSIFPKKSINCVIEPNQTIVLLLNCTKQNEVLWTKLSESRDCDYNQLLFVGVKNGVMNPRLIHVKQKHKMDANTKGWSFGQSHGVWRCV